MHIWDILQEEMGKEEREVADRAMAARKANDGSLSVSLEQS
jgi:hypothetical protein